MLSKGLSRVFSQDSSMITLNVNGLNAATKGHGLSEWTQNRTHIYAVYKRLTSDIDTYREEVRGWEKTLHANENHKKE